MRARHIGWMLVLILGLSGMVLGQCLTEVEDNNTASLADSVGRLPGSGCIRGTIGIVGDVDYYYFDLASSERVLIETITNEDTEIALLDANGVVLAQNDDRALDVLSSRLEAALTAGRYFIAVWEHDHDNVIYDYILNVRTTGCSTEVEDNNTLSLADRMGLVPAELCIAGSIGVVGDLDFYAFEVYTTTNVTLSTVTDGDTEIALYDATGTVLAVNDDIAIDTYWSWIEKDLPPGIYFVGVWEHGDDAVIPEYTLVVNGMPCFPEAEPNDTVSLADNLGILGFNLCASGSIASAGDIDVYQFELIEPKVVVISTQTEGDTQIALFDQWGDTIATNDDVAAGDRSSQIRAPLAAGVYTIAVGEFSGTHGIPSYSLHLFGH